MDYREFKEALEVVDNYLSDSVRRVGVNDSHLVIYVTEAGWPSQVSRWANSSLEGLGWEFNGDIDAWELSS